MTTYEITMTSIIFTGKLSYRGPAEGNGSMILKTGTVVAKSFKDAEKKARAYFDMDWMRTVMSIKTTKAKRYVRPTQEQKELARIDICHELAISMERNFTTPLHLSERN